MGHRGVQAGSGERMGGPRLARRRPAMPSGSRFPSPPPQNFLKHSPKWNIFTVPHSTTLLLPSGCTSML